MVFHPGEVVICVSAQPDQLCQPNQTLKELAEGAYYRVASYFPNGGDARRSTGGVDHRPGHGWYAWRFRKVLAADQEFSDVLRSKCPQPV